MLAYLSCLQRAGVFEYRAHLLYRLLAISNAYLGPDVVETGRRNNAEADKEDVGLRVAERAQAIVVFLASGIPKSQADRFVVDHDTRRVVVKDGRDVLAGEGVGGVGDKQTCLADGTVTGDHAFQRLGCWSSHVMRYVKFEVGGGGRMSPLVDLGSIMR